MEEPNMKKSMKSVLALILCCAIALACVACGGGAKSVTYNLSFTDEDTLTSTTLPVTTVFSFSMMMLQESKVEVTFDGNGTYTYKVADLGNTDPDDPMYFERNWSWTGSYTEADGVYTLSAPTSASESYKCGPTFESYADIFGAPGEYTQENKPELLTMFAACTATVDGESITFTVK